jgi:peptide-methionine (S)-S-oxide reductase
MPSNNYRLLFGLCVLLILAFTMSVSSSIFSRSAADLTPQILAGMKIDPPADLAATTKGDRSIVVAGGCFWGVEAVFEQLNGVSSVVAGYAGGSAKTALYQAVSTGMTGHAEAVEITYDPQQISAGQLLKIYFLLAHDPTQIDRQSPDTGTQYRSAIFFTNLAQQKVAADYIIKLNKAQFFERPIATQLVPLTKFYPAENYHQNFIARNPQYPYVVVHDLPKLARLRQQFPDLIKKG